MRIKFLVRDHLFPPVEVSSSISLYLIFYAYGVASLDIFAYSSYTCVLNAFADCCNSPISVHDRAISSNEHNVLKISSWRIIIFRGLFRSRGQETLGREP